MFNKTSSLIENISSKFAFCLCESKDKSSEEFKVLNYGVFAFLQLITAIVLTILFGILTDTFPEIIIISLMGALLKRNSGGVHCSSPNRCLIAGIILSYIFALIGKKLVNIDQIYIYIIGTVSLIHSFIILYKKCPVPCENKPLKKEDTRKRLRKNSFYIYFVCVILFIINTLLSSIYLINDFNFWVIYVIIGLYMQTISLTIMGSEFILFLDKFLLKLKI